MTLMTECRSLRFVRLDEFPVALTIAVLFVACHRQGWLAVVAQRQLDNKTFSLCSWVMQSLHGYIKLEAVYRPKGNGASA